MPVTLSESSSFDPATAPSAGDIRNAASVQNALQAQTNRGRFVFDRSNPLADIAALKAIVSPADNLVRLVERFGFYVFDSSSGLAESLPWVVQPTTGTGRWLHSLYDVEGAANGLANLDGTGKHTQAQTRNGIISLTRVDLTPAFSTTSAVFVDATGLSLNVTAIAGDILLVTAALVTQNSAGTNPGQARVVVVDGSTVQLGRVVPIPANTSPANGNAVTDVRTVVNSGTVTVKAQALAGASSTATVLGTISVLQIRP